MQQAGNAYKFIASLNFCSYFKGWSVNLNADIEWLLNICLSLPDYDHYMDMFTYLGIG